MESQAQGVLPGRVGAPAWRSRLEQRELEVMGYLEENSRPRQTGRNDCKQGAVDNVTGVSQVQSSLPCYDRATRMGGMGEGILCKEDSGIAVDAVVVTCTEWVLRSGAFSPM